MHPKAKPANELVEADRLVKEPKEETSKEEELLGRLLVEDKAGIEYTEMSKEEYDAELVRLGEELQTIEDEYNTLKE